MHFYSVSHCKPLRHADQVPGPILSKLLDSLCSSLTSESDQTIRDIDHPNPEDDAETQEQAFLMHRRPLEMYAFLLFWMVKVGERLGGRKEMGADEGEVAEVPATRGGRGKVRLVKLFSCQRQKRISLRRNIFKSPFQSVFAENDNEEDPEIHLDNSRSSMELGGSTPRRPPDHVPRAQDPDGSDMDDFGRTGSFRRVRLAGSLLR